MKGAYGADGTEYRTEIESFSKVTSRGVAGRGPSWFEVWTKTGRIMRFGDSADSRLLAPDGATARAWMVKTVSDRVGNAFTVTYVNEPAQAYPSRIDYTTNAGAGLSPYNSVRFVYEARPDAVPSYLGGPSLKTTVRLAKVQTFMEESLVGDYRLTYAKGTATGRSQLAGVTLCTPSGTCLPATTFTWQHGNEGTDGTLNFTASPGFSDWPSPIGLPFGLAVGDWNGDGLSDPMYFWWGLNGGSSVVAVFYVNTGAGFSKVAQKEFNLIEGYNSVVSVGVSDWNADGLSDLVFHGLQFSGADETPRLELNPTNFYANNGFSGGTLNFTASPGVSDWPKAYVTYLCP